MWQKARINLARCMCVDADIYIMDDPLYKRSRQSSRPIFVDEVVKGYSQGKTRIMVAHQLQYLKDVDQILIIQQVFI